MDRFQGIWKRKVLPVLVMLGLSLVLALGLAEGLLRLFPDLLPERAQLRLHWRERDAPVGARSIAHPYIGYLYRALVYGEIRQGAVHFTYTTDGHGFRNPWPWPPEAEIVAVGDSLTFGYGVEDDETWTALLARRLTPNRVINLGLIGGAPQQYTRIYETFGVALRPQVLLYGLFPGNDVRDAGLFDRWLKAGSPGSYDVWHFFEGEVPGLEYGIKSILERSYLLTLMHEAWQLYQAPSPFWGRTLTLPDGSRLRLVPSILASNTAGAHPDHPDFQLVLQAVEDTQTLAQVHGTQLLVLLLPSKEEVYLPTIGAPSPDPVSPFRRAFEERGIASLDLTPGFRQQAREGKGLFFEVDGHPNAAGYALIAEVVHAYLRSNAARYHLKDEG